MSSTTSRKGVNDVVSVDGRDNHGGRAEKQNEIPDLHVMRQGIESLEEKISLVGNEHGAVSPPSREERREVHRSPGRERILHLGAGSWASTKIDFHNTDNGIYLLMETKKTEVINHTRATSSDHRHSSTLQGTDIFDSREFRALKERLDRIEENQKEGLKDQEELKRRLLGRKSRTLALVGEGEELVPPPLGGAHDKDDEENSTPTTTAAVPDRRNAMISNRLISTLGLGGDESSLEADTFSLMMISKVQSQSWVLGCSAFTFQMLLGMMIAFDQVKESSGSTQFDVPFYNSNVVSIGQFLSIILCLATQNDILVSIRSFIILGDSSNWDEVIGEHGERSANTWFVRIALPNIMKLCQGILVTFVSFVIIVQANNIIDLLKDFTALMFISEVDNILFQLASHGYLGDELGEQTKKIEEINVTTKSSTNRSPGASNQRNTGVLYVRLVFLFLLFGMFGWWGSILYRQRNGVFFKQKFPDCKEVDLALKYFGDDECYGGPLNTLECKFENGDCINFNMAYPLCKGSNLSNVEKEVGNKVCNPTFATFQCAYDGGDCCPTSITDSRQFGDLQCNGGKISTENCEYDGGDCKLFHLDFPLCPLDKIADMEGSSDIILGNGICEGVAYANDECGREYRDCDVGQIGQDIIFRGIGSGSSIEFNTRMSEDGSKVMIGMYKTGISDVFNKTSSGKVRVFGLDQAKMKWANTGNDIVGDGAASIFGFGLGMSGDGNFIVVGGPFDANRLGRVKAYRFNAMRNKWVQYGQDFDNSGWTGYNVDMTHDGLRLAIASPPASNGEMALAGKIQVFEMMQLQEAWAQIGQDIYGNEREAIGYFYVRLSSLGSRVYFSAGYFDRPEVALRVYEFNNSADRKWTQLGKKIVTPHIQVHQKPAISGDGDRLAISSYTGIEEEYSRHGEVRIYDLDLSDNNDATWKQLGKAIMAKRNNDRDGFGYNVDMSSDGTLLAIGTLNPDCLGKPKWCPTGSVELYRYDAKNPPHSPFLPLPKKRVANARNIMKEAERDIDKHIFGWDMSLSEDGSMIYVSGYDYILDYGFVKVYQVNDLFHIDCIVPDPEQIGDGICDEFEPFYTKECSYDGGDCAEPVTVEEYPECFVRSPEKIKDGLCDDYLPYNTEQCGYDGGDCLKPVQVEGYPECSVSDPEKIGDSKCAKQQPYIGFECGFDGGDCFPNESNSTYAD